MLWGEGAAACILRPSLNSRRCDKPCNSMVAHLINGGQMSQFWRDLLTNVHGGVQTFRWQMVGRRKIAPGFPYANPYVPKGGETRPPEMSGSSLFPSPYQEHMHARPSQVCKLYGGGGELSAECVWQMLQSCNGWATVTTGVCPIMLQ